MRTTILSSIAFFLFFANPIHAQIQTVQDDFEGNGTIMNWLGDDCEINIAQANPYAEGINTSATVLAYDDIGGDYANVRFEVDNNFDLSSDHTFSLKIYVPSNGLTGNQANKISLKLQDGTLTAPWSTQSEIIKPIVLDQWQTLSFDFLNDAYINLDSDSAPPTQRTDFTRVVIQVNGENNTDKVLAYLDDVAYDGTIVTNPEFTMLVWSDEFDEDGAISASNWHHQTKLPSGGSWFNGEIQHYTNRTDNAYVDDGVLYIVGKKETFTDQGQTKQFTSARLNSKFAFQYGRVEVRAKLPTGVGTWPAIWTLGKNITESGAYWQEQGFGTTGWPACGEIDIMEHWGSNQNYIQSAMHTPSSFGNTENHGGQPIENASTVFHTYTLEWFPDKMVFSVDGLIHYTYQPDVFDANTWPFDAEQYLLLNFAILPSIASNFSQDALEVDYVRVYQAAPNSTATPAYQQVYKLQIQPNPIQDFTYISYQLPNPSAVKLLIHDARGRRIHSLVNASQTAGEHRLSWDAKDLAPGLYYCSLIIGGEVITERFVVGGK